MFSSSKDTSSSGTNNSTVNPWAPQAGALTDAFGNAQTAYNQSSQAQAPTNFTAGYTPDQLATFNSMVQQGGNMAVPNSNAAAGAALNTAGTAGATGALSGLAAFDPTKLNSASGIVDAANSYVNGQDINSQVNNAMLNATQTARDVTMPGIEQNAALGGNTNSSRTGIADGLVQRGLAEQSANLGASLRSQAFQNGLTLAQTQAANNNASTLGALNSAGTIGNSSVNSGVNANNSSIANQTALNNTAVAGGAGQQAANQADLTNQLQQYQSQVSSPYASLQQLMQIIGGQNWGSQTSGTTTGQSTTTSNPSLVDDIGKVGGALSSFF